MNLKKLFEMQKVLDERIVKQHNLPATGNLDWKILALLTELGECANEHRGFKRWSKDQKPRTRKRIDCEKCAGTGIGTNFLKNCSNCNGSGTKKINPLLEEYVDCVHFFISIALELEIDSDDFIVDGDYTRPTATQIFNRVFSTVSSLDVLMDPDTAASISLEDLQDTLLEAFSCFVGLGEKHLGFTWEKIEAAYMEKNATNHVRQAEGY
ncbi:dUTPase [Sporosarcina sp. ANT_H38]|uniref:dUTP diphosphatase n=1 Tax=Sporosarcina sp. ANT_H38 TaxID=2597358 RepID=UPI0011F161D4|nr:dUTP diphosphatase [Sporosarcina sp. ANT_H38]KAA0944101.1 dUTPase [Sporosarcina sp. ANT_H38]